MRVRALPAEERPRERLAREGEKALSLVELLSIVLGASSDGVMEVAGRLVERFGSVDGLVRASIEELVGVRGVGKAKAVLIKAALEMGRRCERIVGDDIARPGDVWERVCFLMDGSVEELFVVMRDVRGRLVGIEKVGVGTIDEVLVHPREVFGPVVRRGAARFVLVHTHPSGDVKSSRSDDAVTRHLMGAAEVMRIGFDDHVIVGNGNYFSYWEQGLIQREVY